MWHRGVAPGEGGAEPGGGGRFGWLGRSLPGLGGPRAALHVGGGEPPAALFGASGPAPSIRDAAAYRLRGAAPAASALSGGGLLDVVRAATAEATASAARVREALDAGDGGASYPATGLGDRLKLVGRLIRAGMSERVYYTDFGGFDTHAVQAAHHPGLLAELGDAVAAFFADLRDAGQAERVTLLAFSEFGRRVAENGSGGTDHGVAGPLFLAGPKVRAGLIGEHPSLTDLDAGDLKWRADFRTVYAALLDDWLGIDADAALGGRWERAAVWG